jgi:hypothetical protein
MSNRRDPVGPDLSGKTLVRSARQSKPVPAPSRMNSVPQSRIGAILWGRTYPGRRWFRQQDVEACPGPFPNKFGPTMSNRRDPVGPDLSGKTLVRSARQSKPVLAPSRINSVPQCRISAILWGRTYPGRRWLRQQDVEACPGPFPNKFGPTMSNRRDPVGPDLSGKALVRSARQSKPVLGPSRINSVPLCRISAILWSRTYPGRRWLRQQDSRSLSWPLPE